jgi:hypothetical protein
MEQTLASSSAKNGTILIQTAKKQKIPAGTILIQPKRKKISFLANVNDRRYYFNSNKKKKCLKNCSDQFQKNFFEMKKKKKAHF